MPGLIAKAKSIFVEKAREVTSFVASYDVTKTSRKNQEYYATAQNLSGDNAASASNRTVIRNRSRYEYRNNSFMRAMVDGRSEDVVGRGARLHVNLPDDQAAAERIERAWLGWARAINLPEKLKIAEKEVAGGGGEVFIIPFTNEAVKHPIKLDLMVIEAERCATPTAKSTETTDPLYIDGITVDEMGNPISYDILTDHPGNALFVGSPTDEYRTFPASSVYHWFDKDRPSLHRGVPSITPGLQNFGYLRRYTQSVVLASEIAANNAYTLESQTSDAEEIQEGLPFETMALEQGQMTVMPYGYQAKQMKPEQPTNTYPDFVRAIVTEIGRSLRLPAHVALGDSSGYNYASGRLDKQEYHKTIVDRQTQMGIRVLDGIFFDHWLREAALVPGLISLSAGQVAAVRALNAHEWYWDGFEHVDPIKEANAQNLRLQNGTTTYKSEYAKQGKDWIEELTQISAERKMMDTLGLSFNDITNVEEGEDNGEEGQSQEN